MQKPMRAGHYDAFLLRIWRGGEENQWRWMLQNVRTGEQKGFRNMNALVQFLDTKYGQANGRSGVESVWGELGEM